MTTIVIVSTVKMKMIGHAIHVTVQHNVVVTFMNVIVLAIFQIHLLNAMMAAKYLVLMLMTLGVIVPTVKMNQIMIAQLVVGVQHNVMILLLVIMRRTGARDQIGY